MEKTKIAEIVNEGQILLEKRSWISKGYVDLLAAINAELAKIPDMPEDAIEYTLKEYTHYSDRMGQNLNRRLTVDLVFMGDALIVMRLGKEDPFRGSWDWEDINNPSLVNIRLFASKIADMLDFYLAEIKKRNAENQTAIDIMAGIVEKLK
jgi:hypothetical protein